MDHRESSHPAAVAVPAAETPEGISAVPKTRRHRGRAGQSAAYGWRGCRQRDVQAPCASPQSRPFALAVGQTRQWRCEGKGCRNHALPGWGGNPCGRLQPAVRSVSRIGDLPALWQVSGCRACGPGNREHGGRELRLHRHGHQRIGQGGGLHEQLEPPERNLLIPPPRCRLCNQRRRHRLRRPDTPSGGRCVALGH